MTLEHGPPKEVLCIKSEKEDGELDTRKKPGKEKEWRQKKDKPNYIALLIIVISISKSATIAQGWKVGESKPVYK